MGTVISFAAAPRTKGWTDQEKAEIYRAASMLAARGLPFETASGVSDAGDPWFVLTGRDTGEVLVHFARIDGQFVAHYTSANVLLHGREFRELIDRVLFGSGTAGGRTAANTVYSTGAAAVLAFILVDQVKAMAAVERELEFAASGEDGLLEGVSFADGPVLPHDAGNEGGREKPALPSADDATAPDDGERAAVPADAGPGPAKAGKAAEQAPAQAPAAPQAQAAVAAAVTVIRGTEGDDHIVGTDGDDSIEAGGGNDTVEAAAGDDTVDGGAGDDLIFGAAGTDLLRGGEGDDEIDGGADADVVEGGEGADVLRGGAGDDTVRGGEGGDAIDGGAGNDTLNGNGGNDVVAGGGGDDLVVGGGGHDLLVGGAGSDRLVLGNGGDVAVGGSGADSFVVLRSATSDGLVSITELRSLIDSLKPGDLAPGTAGNIQASVAAGTVSTNLVADFNRADGDRVALGTGVSDVGVQTLQVKGEGFEFINAFGFSGDGTSQIRVVAGATSTRVEVDADGNGSADFTLDLLGVVKLTAADFGS